VWPERRDFISRVFKARPGSFHVMILRDAIVGPFDQTVSTTGIDRESVNAEVEVTVDDGPPPKDDFKFEVMDASWEPPEGGCAWAYDVETYPDAPKPDVPVYDKQPLDMSAILKSEATAKSFINSGVHAEDAQQVRDAEIAGKNRKGVNGVLKKYCEGGNEELQAWKNLSKCPWTCRIVAMSICFFDDPVPKVWLAEDKEHEKQLLDAWFRMVDTGRLRVGYNTASYDDPCLVHRAIKMGVTPQQPVDLGRYAKGTADICLKMFGTVANMQKLKSLLPQYGITPPAGDVDGSHVQEMIEGGQWEELARYVASDGWAEMELFKRVQGVLRLF